MRTVALLVTTLALGCWVEPAHQRRGPSPEPTPAAPSPEPTTPRLTIDTGRTLHASPGQGAGLFVTAQSGGAWLLEWTCDSAVNPGSTCPFEIAVGTTGLAATPVALPATALVSSDEAQLRIKTTTTSTIDRVTFRTTPGASISLSMRLRGQPYPSLVFFVSGGALSTAPTDPIELVPSEP